MKRQAVVVIHGIGEQKPMSTLRGFVDSLSDYTSEKEWIQVYNIPDTISGSYELRELALYYGKDLRTDFFEYYWAHNMRGTKLSTVWTWLVQLMLRKPTNIPRRIRWIYFLLWFVALTYMVLIASGANTLFQNTEWTKLPFIVFAGNIILNFLAVILTLYLGDAARYTYAAPENIEERNKIRKGGIDLLDRLHKSGKYSRIIVVGHSLGSMIGYDMLKYFWAQVYKNFTVSKDYPRTQMDRFNQSSKTGFDLSSKEKMKTYMEIQDALLKEQQARGNNWLISDFITLGCPLAHGELLMAESPESFMERKKERELPTNPPLGERNGGISYSQPFASGPSSKQGYVNMEIIHHAGHFAFTQWHNLYYKMDFVGGPLKKVFGAGINDVLVNSDSVKAKIPFIMHTNYWADPKKDKAIMRESIDYLKKVILKPE